MRRDSWRMAVRIGSGARDWNENCEGCVKEVRSSFSRRDTHSGDLARWKSAALRHVAEVSLPARMRSPLVRRSSPGVMPFPLLCERM